MAKKTTKKNGTDAPTKEKLMKNPSVKANDDFSQYDFDDSTSKLAKGNKNNDPSVVTFYTHDANTDTMILRCEPIDHLSDELLKVLGLND